MIGTFASHHAVLMHQGAHGGTPGSVSHFAIDVVLPSVNLSLAEEVQLIFHNVFEQVGIEWDDRLKAPSEPTA
jgi:hypothetical protein